MQPSWREIHRWDFQQRPGELLVDRVVLNDLDLFVRARVVIDGYAEAPNRTITQPYYTLELVGDAQGEAP